MGNTLDAQSWNALISGLPNPHLLQTHQWGQIKEPIGWRSHYQVWREGDGGQLRAAALILQRDLTLPGLPFRFRMLYAPKGPLLADWGDVVLRQRVLSDLRQFARQRGAFLLKIDPDVRLGLGVPGESEAHDDPLGLAITAQLKGAGWQFSGEQVQYRNTVLVDLAPSEDDLLANMKQKTRYNVRLAGRKGVSVRLGGPGDFDTLNHMYAQTAVRDGFAIRGQDYYHHVWDAFYRAGMLKPLIAEVEGQPVAALMLFLFGERAWYLHGMSSGEHRNLMPNYLLQWEAMRLAKREGCLIYDLWGAPDVFAPFDSMWGVYRFKHGLGGQVVRHLGAWDLPVRPWQYRLYTQLLPRLLDVMRRRGVQRTRSQVQGGE